MATPGDGTAMKRQYRSTTVLPALNLAIALVMAVAAGHRSAQARPIDYKGLSLAYPINQPIVSPRFLVDTLVSEQVIPALISIDSTGCVLEVVPRRAADSAYITPYQDLFRRTDFAPGMIDGKPVPQTLPVRLRLQPRVPFPIVLFPRDSTGELGQPELYEEALKRSGYEPPEVEQFPWFHCDLKASDTSAIYRQVLIRIALDSLGGVTDLEILRSTFDAFASQVASAANYATFRPARRLGQPVAAITYLLISFFSELSYPSPVWRDRDSASAPYLRYESVRLVPDSQALLSLPIPWLSSQGEFGVNGPVPPVDSLSIRFDIDTLGRAKFQRIYPQTGKTIEFAHVLNRQLRFYPALRFDGSPVPYSVLANITVLTPKTIRIRYSWMSPSSL